MLEKIKSKWRTSKYKPVAQAPIEIVGSPSHSPPNYIGDNPMFPTRPSLHENDESMGFVLGTEYPKLGRKMTKMENREGNQNEDPPKQPDS
jgi:hypothetical protein